MIITLRQAVNDGYTPNTLRVLANSLDRIARNGYAKGEPCYDYRSLRQNAGALRRLAGELQKFLALPNVPLVQIETA